MTPAATARIHLLPAQASPYVLVIRRKPSKWFHIIRWNTQTNTLEHGSWLKGKLYAKRCDISFDGQWMVYLALGASGSHIWNGICRLPYLRTVAEGPNTGTWYGGGYWRDSKSLLLNQWQPTKGEVPFQLAELQPKFGGEDLGVLYPKWERDGWQRRGDNYGTDRKLKGKSYRVACEGDDGWQNKPSRKHPALIAQYVGYLEHGYTFRFRLDGFDDLLDNHVDSACWDSLGNLVYSRKGILYKYTLNDLKNRRPGIIHDLESLSKNE